MQMIPNTSTTESTAPPSTPSCSNETECTPLIKKESGSRSTEISAGLTIQQTAVLIAGEMGGSGVLALPRALSKTGWFGVPLMVLVAAMAAFSGQRLGECWTIIEARDPEMRTRKRNPYAIIVEQSLGKKWSVAVSLAIIVTLFGAAVVSLLLAAQIIESVVLALLPRVSMCIWYLVITCALTPFLFFGTPKDFHLLGTIGFGTSIVACILYIAQMLSQVSSFTFRYGMHGFMDVFLAYGTMMFSFGGASTFPTIQNDMADKSKFGKALQYSFLAILALYLIVSITAYAVFGERVLPNVALTLAPSALTLAANMLMAVHLLAACIIIINPVCQEMEEFYRVPRDSFRWRVLVRVSIMGAILFVGESIPRFYTVLALIGATTIALLTYIVPSLCYLVLTSESSDTHTSVGSCWKRRLCYEVIVLAVLGAIAATISALNAVFNTAMVTPCYFW